ncbi:glycosyltransferase family 4 protein [bacterium]|nr:glycosyltransferase family 4 protein [bacterium]
MRIGFDIRSFLKEETGVGIYLKNLLSYLSMMDWENEYYLFSTSLKDRFPLKKVPEFKKMKFREFYFPVKAVDFAWNKLRWPEIDCFFRTNLDLTHSHTPLVLPTKGKKVVTVHDLYFMDYPDRVDQQAGRYFTNQIRSSLKRAEGIITVSKSTKRQLLEKFPVEEKKIKVIYHGLDPAFQTPVSPKYKEKITQRFSLPQRFLLFVGSTEPRKNLTKLLQSFPLVRREYPNMHLVLAGPQGKDYELIQKRIRKDHLYPWIHITGYVSQTELKALYRLASVFVFPSFCEGFGFPLIEAMASGVPLAVSNKSVMPEIVKNAGLYFNPHDPEEMAGKVMSLLDDNRLRQRLIKEGFQRASHFDWKKAASETLSLYQSLIKEKR